MPKVQEGSFDVSIQDEVCCMQKIHESSTEFGVKMILKQDEEVTVFGSWHSTLKVDSLCGFSDFWSYWEHDPILTHNFKLRGSTTKSESFGCWICPNFPTVFLWVVRPKVSWAAKWEISRRSGGSTNNVTRKSKRWNQEELSTCIHIDRGFLGYQQMTHGVCFEENTKLKLPFIHEWLDMCPPYSWFMRLLM